MSNHSALLHLEASAGEDSHNSGNSQVKIQTTSFVFTPTNKAETPQKRSFKGAEDEHCSTALD